MTEAMVVSRGDGGTSENTQTPGSPKGRKPVEKRWIIVVATWFFLLGLGFYGLQKLTENNPGPFAHLLSSGEASQLSPARHLQLANLVRQKSHDLKADVPVLIYENAEERIDASFDQLQRAVDEYLEWHFSTTASYLRLFISMTDDLDEWAANKIGEKLEDASGYTQAMESLTNDFPKIQTNFILNESDKFRLEVDYYLNTHGSVVELSDLPPETPLLDLSQLVRSSDLPLELDVIVASANVGKITSASVGIVGAAASSPAVMAAMADVKRFRNRAIGQAAKSGAKGAARTAATSFTGPLRIPANVTGHSGHRDRFAHGHHAGVGFVL